MTQPIYNKKLETRPVFENHVSRMMTEEEAIRLGVPITPARNFDGRILTAPTFQPFLTTEQKAVKLKKVVEKKPKPKAKMGRKEDPRFMHVTKEFIQAEMEAGKTLHFIGKENGMSKALVYKRAKAFGLYSAKPYVGVKHDK